MSNAYTKDELDLKIDSVHALAEAVIKQWKKDGAAIRQYEQIEPWLEILKTVKK
jgi:hypothetical protein